MAYISKEKTALCMLRSNPNAWFRDATLDERDRALFSASPVSFVDYNKGSYLRKIYHMKAGEDFKATEWLVETDEECKKLVESAGAKLHGFNSEPTCPPHWASVAVNVNIQGTPGSGFDWGFLTTRPHNIRIFRGPSETCKLHPWDAMILRDCGPNTGGIGAVESIASRNWDILCMKMCEDYDHPWVVVAVKDAGPVPLSTPGMCSCQDPSACGCIIVD